MKSLYLVPVVAFALVVIAANADRGTKNLAVDRGRYIVNSVSMCVDCHTPKLANHRPDAKRMLAGAPIMFKPTMKMKNWEDHAPNLTSGEVGGKWTDKQLITLLMTGKDTKGKYAEPPMPGYRLNAEDAAAVVAYLRSLPKVKDKPSATRHTHTH